MKFSLITFALLCVGSIYAQKDIDKMEPFISFYFEKKMTIIVCYIVTVIWLTQLKVK